MEPMAAEQVQETPAACLLSSLTRLMTQYALRPTPGAAGAVVRVLSALLVHPQVCRNALLHNTYGRMLPHWQGLMAGSEAAYAGAAGAGPGGGSVH